jgi:L-rhamnose mutarotase
MEQEYLRLHRSVWPEVLRQITASNIRNYTIFLRDGMLFSYYEYVGQDHAADMAAMAADPATRDWWKLTDPCQHQVRGMDPGQRWAPMAEVFHGD